MGPPPASSSGNGSRFTDAEDRQKKDKLAPSFVSFQKPYFHFKVICFLYLDPKYIHTYKYLLMSSFIDNKLASLQ